MANLDRTTAPPIKAFGNLDIPETRTVTLDNGIPLTILDNGEQEVNRITLAWDGGIAETLRPSVATIATNILREGTKHHNGAEIAETIDFNGSWLRTHVHSHHTSMVLHSLNSRTANVLPYIAEIISEPSFPEKELSVVREKTARNSELDREKVEFYSAHNLRRMLMGKEHPLAQSESPDKIRAITVNDIEAFHSRIFSTSTCRIYLAGRITPAIEDTVNRHFGSAHSNGEGCKLNIIPFSPLNDIRESVFKKKDALQSSVKLAIPTIDRNHSDYIPLRIAIIALGGYFGSRLMMNIREDKGYTYGINASLLGYREGGMLTISTQCDNSYVNPVIDETVKEIKRLASEQFPADELERLKHYVMTQLASLLDSPFSMMDYYENIQYTPTPTDYFAQQINAIKSLTADDIPRLISKHLNLEQIYTSICGDIS